MYLIKDLVNDIKDFFENDSDKQFSFEANRDGWKSYKHKGFLYDSNDSITPYKILRLYVYEQKK